MSTVKVGPKPELRDRVILTLKKQQKATASDLEQTTSYLTTLVHKGFVKVVAKQKPAGRGRKANIYSLTPKGRNRARTLNKRVAA